MQPSLAWLLQPLTVEDFFAEVWGVTHHHVKDRGTTHFDDLLPGLSTVDQLVEHVRSDPSVVRLVKGAEHKDSDAYRLADDSLNLDGVHRDLADGYTIIVDHLEQYARPITSLSHSIEVELNYPVQVNAYVTPPGATGFLPHYDHHDVLILQMQGSKLWHLHGDTAVPPHELQRRQEFYPDALPPPSDSPTDVQLTAGDTLYLPRGRIHSAETTTQPSIHLTVGLHVPTALTLLSHTLHLLSLRDDRIHTPLPPRHLNDPETRAKLGALLQETLRLAGHPAAVREGLHAMEGLLVRRGRCPPVGQAADVAGLDGQTRVAKYSPLYSRVVAVPGSVTLQFAQLAITTAPDHEAALHFLSSSTEPFRIAELPGLTAAQQIELARTLIISGFLVRQ